MHTSESSIHSAPTPQSSIHTPSRFHQPVSVLSHTELSYLSEWAAGVRDNPDTPSLVQLMADSLCHLLEMRQRTTAPNVRASVDVNIARVLGLLEGAGLTP